MWNASRATHPALCWCSSAILPLGQKTLSSLQPRPIICFRSWGGDAQIVKLNRTCCWCWLSSITHSVLWLILMYLQPAHCQMQLLRTRISTTTFDFEMTELCNQTMERKQRLRKTCFVEKRLVGDCCSSHNCFQCLRADTPFRKRLRCENAVKEMLSQFLDPRLVVVMRTSLSLAATLTFYPGLWSILSFWPGFSLWFLARKSVDEWQWSLDDVFGYFAPL